MPRSDDPQIGLAKAIRQLLLADIHPTWISHLESGRVNPTWGNVRRIAKGLRIPLSALAALAEDLELQYGTAPQPGQAAGGQ